MVDPGTTTVQVEHWLERLRMGDEAARNALLDQTCRRLRGFAERMLRGFPGVQRWEQPEDVLQNALLRLTRVLRDTTPESALHYFNLASLAIRRELFDLAKHHCGPRGRSTHHDTVGPGIDPVRRMEELAPQTSSTEPLTPDDWARFHQEVDRLPDEEREVCNLLYYQGLSQPEAADLLDVSERTVARRWSMARLKIHRALQGSVGQ